MSSEFPVELSMLEGGGHLCSEGGREQTAGDPTDLTEPQPSHRELVEINQQLEKQITALFQSSPECIKVVAPDGTLLQMNRAGLEMVQAENAHDVLGKCVYDLVAPEDREEFRAMNERVCQGATERFEFEIIGLKGARLLMETHAAPLRDVRSKQTCQLAITRNITDRKEVEKLQSHFTSIVDSSDDAIISKDLNGTIQSWNEGAERIFGYTAKEVIGKSVTVLIPKGRRNEEPEILARLRRGERIDHYETIRQCKDGSLVHISLTVSPIKDERGNVIGASKIARDITERRRIQEALRLANEQLAEANEDLEQRVKERTASLREAMAQMEEFSYTVSHDLRAPARAIRGYANIVLQDFAENLAPPAKEYLERIIRGGARMDTLIQDILAYSRLSRRELTLEPVILDKVVDDIIQQDPQLQPPQARTIVLAPLGPVVAHEPSLTQAISNLLTNSAKFVPAGEVPRITVRTELRGTNVRLWVEDNGIGIKPEYQHLVFGVFERLTTDIHYEGTGIGLAIVRRAVEKMGGNVGLESDGLTGSRFWIELPAAL